MRKLIVIFLNICLFCFWACSKVKITTADLISIQDWDSLTKHVIIDEMRLDTVLKYNDNKPPLVISGIHVKSVDENLNYYLSFREKIVETIQKDKTLSHNEKFKIYESHGSCVRRHTFSVLVDDKMSYRYEIWNNQDSVLFINKTEINNDAFLIRSRYMGVELGTMTGINILTSIERTREDKLLYDIMLVEVR